MTHEQAVERILASGFQRMDGDIQIDIFTAPEECGDAVPAIVLVRTQYGMYSTPIDLSLEDLLECEMFPFATDVVLAEGDEALAGRGKPYPNKLTGEPTRD